MEENYFYISGFFSLPDGTDLDNLKETDYLRIIADELEKRPPPVDSINNQKNEVEEELLKEEIKYTEKYFSLHWDRFWRTRRRGEFQNCYSSQVGNNYGIRRHNPGNEEQ